MPWYSAAAQGRARVGRYFLAREFASPDGADRLYLDPRLPELLDDLCEALGSRLIVLSGYRTPAYNRRLTGVPAGPHTQGRAVDLAAEGRAPADIARALAALCRSRGAPLRVSSAEGWCCHLELPPGRTSGARQLNMRK